MYYVHMLDILQNKYQALTPWPSKPGNNNNNKNNNNNNNNNKTEYGMLL